MTKILVTLTLAVVLCTSFPNVRANSFTDDDLINFALNLECLEAEFYSWAAFGKGLTYKQRGGGPASIGGMKAELGDYAGIAEEIAMEEIRHVELLRGALGAEAVRCPKIDVGPAFAAAANAALGTTLKPPFSPYPDFLKFLIGGLLFEDVGVMAYNGAIGLIKSPEYLIVARGIMAVEAYHAGVIRALLSKEFTTLVSPYNVPVSTITTAVAAAVDGLLGLARKQPIGSPSGTSNLTPTDGNALVFAVNPDAVLNVVYLSKTAKKGGFFPHGINGFFMQTRGLFEIPCMGKTKVARYAQCGGATYTGPTCCEGCSTCVKVNDFYSQCMPK